MIATASVAQTPPPFGALHVSGTQLTGENGEPVVLRGTSFGWHCFWPRFYESATVAWLKKDFGVTVVRAALGVEQGNEKSYLANPELGMKCIENVIEGALKSGVYVIVDWHSHNINQAEAEAFFNRISKKYGHHPHIIYEVFNEPDEETWPEVKKYAEAVIKVIRQNDPDNIILVGSPRWDQDIHLPAADPIKGYSNLMYTMHFYAATHGKWLRDRTDEALAAGLPIFVSECAGMEATGDGPIDEVAWHDYVTWMESKKISWVIWSVSDKDETCSILRASASSTGKWRETDIKPWGQLARESIRTYTGKH